MDQGRPAKLLTEKTVPGSVRRTFSISAQVALCFGGVAVVSALLEPPGPRRQRLFWIAAGMAVTGIILAFTAYRTDPRVVENGPIDRMPPQERIKALKVLLPVAIVAFGTLSVFTARDLWHLETGQRKSVQLWSLVGLVYDLFGPWIAASVFPALLVLVTVGLRGKWLRAKEELEG